MASVEEVITELKKLRPEQVDEVARIIHGLSQTGCGEAPLVGRGASNWRGASKPAVAARVVDEAIQHGWPAELFTEVIGSLPELERSAQPPVEIRANL